MIVALLLALANPNLVAVDDANLALTACGFVTHREAAQANNSLDQFRAALGNRCAGEIVQMRRALMALETGRGKSQSAARLSADGMIAGFHANFAGGYARRHESQAQIKALIDAIEREGTSDAK